MAELDYRSSYYRPRVKDTLLRELAQMPGADALQLENEQMGAVDLADRNAWASLATHRTGDASSELRALLSLPEEQRLFGVVGVTLDGQEDQSLYGLSALPVIGEKEAAHWQNNITRGIARIHPDMLEAQASRELPWSVTILSHAGSLAVKYRGDEHADVIGVPQVEGQTELDIAPELWCPPAAELVELVKPTA